MNKLNKYYPRLKHFRAYSPETVLLLLSRFMVIILAGLSSACLAKDYYVATDGSDSHSGSKTEPWRTIQHAADTLQPGDTVYIRGGVYRECVQPGRGGTSEDKRIAFKAYPGEIPMIKGSEPIATWQEQGNNVWKAVIPDTFFGDYNPYTTKITGEWMGWGSPLTGGVALDDLSFRNINHENEVAKNPRSWSPGMKAQRRPSMPTSLAKTRILAGRRSTHASCFSSPESTGSDISRSTG